MSERVLWACLVLVLAGSAARAAAPQPARLLATADAARHPLQEGTIRIRATVEENGLSPAVSELEVTVRGADRALLAFREGALAGRKVLSVAGKTWLLVPGTTRPVPVAASQRLIGGASIADVARLRFADEFEGTIRGEETVDGAACWVLDLVAKSKKAPYASGTLWISEDDSLARRARLALRSGKEAKEVRFVSYDKEHGKSVLRRMEILHRLEPERGLRTVLEFLRYEPGTVPDTRFDPAQARSAP